MLPKGLGSIFGSYKKWSKNGFFPRKIFISPRYRESGFGKPPRKLSSAEMVVIWGSYIAQEV